MESGVAESKAPNAATLGAWIDTAKRGARGSQRLLRFYADRGDPHPNILIRRAHDPNTPRAPWGGAPRGVDHWNRVVRNHATIRSEKKIPTVQDHFAFWTTSYRARPPNTIRVPRRHNLVPRQRRCVLARNQKDGDCERRDDTLHPHRSPCSSLDVRLGANVHSCRMTCNGPVDGSCMKRIHVTPIPSRLDWG
jgi:hypothetical protein